MEKITFSWLKNGPKYDALSAPQALVCIDGIPVRRVQKWPITIGQALTSNIVLDNVYAAEEHAELRWTDRGIEVQVLDSKNGIYVGSKHLRAGQSMVLSPGMTLDIGGQHISIRTVDDPSRKEVSIFRHAIIYAFLAILSIVAWVAIRIWSHPYSVFENVNSAFLPWLDLIIIIVFFCSWFMLANAFYPSRGYPQRQARILFHGSILTLSLIVIDLFLSLLEHAFVLDAMRILRPYLLILSMAAGIYVICRSIQGVVSSWSKRIIGGAILACMVSTYIFSAHIKPSSHAYTTVIGPPILRMAPLKNPNVLMESIDNLKGRVDDEVRRKNAE